ncbi:hypothetical protein IJJ08_03900 [bacterium]|nr:hypothetical protein [bacterium]
MATLYTDLVKRAQSGANSNSSYSPYRDQMDNGRRDGSTQYAPSSQYTPTASSTQSRPQASTSSSNQAPSFDVKNRDANPGDGYFWDAADGWKQISQNVSNDYDAQLEAARKAEEERQARLRAEINNGWDQVDSRLNSIADRIPTQRDEQTESIGNMYDTSAGKLNTARDYANSQIDANQKTTLNDLSDRLRAALQAGNTYLGARGSSDSSANDRYSTALLKQANKQQGNVMMQADSQRSSVQNTYDNNMAQLDEWKNTKTYEVGQWYNEALNNIDRERANASGERAQALAQLEANLHQQALTRLAQIEDAANSWKNSVNAWLLEQQGNTSNGVNLLNATPQALSYENFGNLQMGNQITTPILGANYNATNDDDKAGTSSLYFNYNAANPVTNTKMTY